MVGHVDRTTRDADRTIDDIHRTIGDVDRTVGDVDRTVRDADRAVIRTLGSGGLKTRAITRRHRRFSRTGREARRAIEPTEREDDGGAGHFFFATGSRTQRT